jgi:hypothetical protein
MTQNNLRSWRFNRSKYIRVSSVEEICRDWINCATTVTGSNASASSVAGGETRGAPRRPVRAAALLAGLEILRVGPAPSLVEGRKVNAGSVSLATATRRISSMFSRFLWTIGRALSRSLGGRFTPTICCATPRSSAEIALRLAGACARASTGAAAVPATAAGSDFRKERREFAPGRDVDMASSIPTRRGQPPTHDTKGRGQPPTHDTRDLPLRCTLK